MNLNRADLPLLVSLSVLLEEANVTRAAARLHISQPALSAHLARLRDVLGDPLLVPSESGRGMVPTARALSLQQPLREILERLDALVGTQDRFDPIGAERTFRIAANDNATAMVGVGLVRRFADYGPGLRLAFRDIAPGAATRALEQGEIDLLLASRRVIPAGLASQPLFEDRFRVARRRGHPSGAGPIDLDTYCRGRHVIVSPNGAFDSAIDVELARLSLRRHVVAAVPNYALVPLVLAATDHFCTLPERFLGRHADTLDVVDAPLDLPGIALAMAWHPRSETDAAHRWLRDRVLEEARA
jgi:DNA-binding transcriptional LysR family regulator